MKRFKIRDLVIDVLPEGEEVAAAAGGCQLLTCFTCTQSFTCINATCTPLSCGGMSVACGGCTLNITTFTQGCCDSCHPAITNTGPLLAMGRNDLAVLRAELERELQAVAQREADLDDEMRPKSTEDMDQLEASLEAALETLREERQKLDE